MQVRYAEGRKVYRLPFSRYVKFDETSVVGNSMMKTDDRPSEKELLIAEAIVPDDNVIGAVSKAFAMQTPRISPRFTKGIASKRISLCAGNHELVQPKILTEAIAIVPNSMKKFCHA